MRTSARGGGWPNADTCGQRGMAYENGSIFEDVLNGRPLYPSTAKDLFLFFPSVAPPRSVQYVHWVMYKCIMVKVGGERNTHKVCKKQVNFSKTGGIFSKVGGK